MAKTTKTFKPARPVVPPVVPVQRGKALVQQVLPPTRGRPVSPGKSNEALAKAPGQQGKMPPGTKKRQP